MTRPDRTKILVFPIARVDDPKILQDIASYVHEVEDFKSAKVLSPDLKQVEAPFLGSADEHEGSTWVEARYGYEMVRKHAEVRNSLRDLIKNAGYRVERDLARDILVGSPAKPDVEFELKTSYDSQSIYIGVGQLLMHNTVYPAKQRVLVVPIGMPHDRHRSVSKLGIRIIEYELTRREIHYHSLSEILSRVSEQIPRQTVKFNQ